MSTDTTTKSTSKYVYIKIHHHYYHYTNRKHKKGNIIIDVAPTTLSTIALVLSLIMKQEPAQPTLTVSIP